MCTGFFICHLSIFCGKLLWIHWISRWKIWVEVTGCLKNVRDLLKLSCFSFLLPLVQSLLLPPAQDLSHGVCSLPPRWICFSKTKLSLDPPTALSTDAQCQTSYQDKATLHILFLGMLSISCLVPGTLNLHFSIISCSLGTLDLCTCCSHCLYLLALCVLLLPSFPFYGGSTSSWKPLLPAPSLTLRQISLRTFFAHTDYKCFLYCTAIFCSPASLPHLAVSLLWFICHQ